MSEGHLGAFSIRNPTTPGHAKTPDPNLTGRPNSKNISHATLSNQSSFPQVQLIRGNLFLTLGHTIRPAYDPTKAKSKSTDPAQQGNSTVSTMELLPEEALYLLERGSLQIWLHPSAYDAGMPSPVEGEAEWDDEAQGFRGCVEMSVMEGFSRFIGRDGLTLERYQVGFVLFC